MEYYWKCNRVIYNNTSVTGASFLIIPVLISVLKLDFICRTFTCIEQFSIVVLVLLFCKRSENSSLDCLTLRLYVCSLEEEKRANQCLDKATSWHTLIGKHMKTLQPLWVRESILCIWKQVSSSWSCPHVSVLFGHASLRHSDLYTDPSVAALKCLSNPHSVAESLFLHALIVC